MPGRNIVSLCRLIFLVLLAAALLSACGKGPFSPEAMRQSQERDSYLKLLKDHLIADDTFEWDTLSSALIVRILPYKGDVRRSAENRFFEAPPFKTETASWDKRRKNGSAAPVIILLGFYNQSLKEKDITKDQRFRPRLQLPDGRVLTPFAIKRFGRDKAFIRDYFPVFNPWEEVYLVKFDPPARLNGTVNFLLEWPGGTQSLPFEM